MLILVLVLVLVLGRTGVGYGAEEITVDLLGGVTMEFVWIEPGTFAMGSLPSEPDRNADEGPQREVTILRGFWLGKYEITQTQWEGVMGSNPSFFNGPDRPVERISWHDVRDFIARLNAVGEEIFRLPTEAEWEYACRAGTTTRWSFGDDESSLPDYAWYSGNNSPDETKDVGEKRPNPWGLHDMHGNVAEWCQDWYGSYSSSAQTDPTGPASGSARVPRGGDYDNRARGVRSAYRGFDPRDYKYNIIGARLLKVGPKYTDVTPESWGKVKIH